MEDQCKWRVEEMAAWARKGRLVKWLEPVICHAVPWDGAVSADEWPLLENILNAAGRFRPELLRLFAATALLTPPPEKYWNILPLLFPEARLTDWLHAAWRLVSIPCVGNDPVIIPLMCGHSTERLSGVEPANLSTETIQAIGMAARLATRKWGGHFACWHWSGKNSIDGASLGLPVYLGFGCAAEGLPMPQALATGKLNPAGGIESVAHVEDKASLAEDRTFLIPEANSAESLTACIPVRHVDDAWEIWKSCGQGGRPEYLRTLIHCLDAPERLFPFLTSCTEAEIGFLDTDARVARIQAALKEGIFPVAQLRSLLDVLATSREQPHIKARDLILKIFPHTDLHWVADRGSALAWRLAMLHLRAFNHSGHPRKAFEIREKARKWENELEFSDNEEELISHSLGIVGMLHNTYRFHQNPAAFLGASLEAQMKELENQYAAGNRKRNKPLGDWFGTLGQHHAFRGEIAEAENMFGRAISCFEGRPRDQRQSLSCRFFARLDSAKSEAVDDLLAVLGLQDLNVDLQAHIQGITNEYSRSWALFALARYAKDGKDAPPSLRSTLAEVAETVSSNGQIWEMMPERHPWQLILFNLGFLAQTNETRTHLWQTCLKFCLSDKFGPTIRVMALLPLSAMKSYGMDLPENTEETVAQLCEIIKEELDTTHFAPVLAAPDGAGALNVVAENRHKLFPFNYR